jgi:hypothetical protein
MENLDQIFALIELARSAPAVGLMALAGIILISAGYACN